MNPIKKTIKAFAAVMATIFGRISWTPPSWAKAAGGTVKRNWRKIIVGAGVLAAACVLAVLGYAYYLTHQPVKIEVSGSSPGPTRLEKDARPDPLHIYFNGSAANLEDIDKVVEKGISINPPIKGEWRWKGDAELTFTPAEDWAVGQEYTVRFEKSLFPAHVHLESYTYEFSSAPFKARLVSSEFYQDPKNPKLKKVVVTVRFSHPVDTSDFEKRVSLSMSGEKSGILGTKAGYPFKVTYDEFKGEAYIHSDPITIPLKETYMEFKIGKGARSERGGPPAEEELSGKVLIPSVYTFFRVNSAEVTLVRNEKYEPEQVLVVENTAGVLESVMNSNISVYVLPKDRPEIPGRKKEYNYDWYSPAEVGPETLKLSEPVRLGPIPAEREYSNVHSYRIDVGVGKYLYIKVNKGISSFGDYVLAKEFDAIIRVPDYPKELNIMHDGALLSMAGEKKLSVLSRGIDAVRFEVARVIPGQINNLVSQTEGSFKDPYFNYNFGQDNITERFTEVRRLKPLPPNKTQYTAFDFTKYLGPAPGSVMKRGLFFFKVESWDMVHDRPTGASDKRLILVTDLGIVVKNNAAETHDVFVMSIDRGEPVQGAKVEVLGINGLPVVDAYTDANGHAEFPNLADFEREKKPVAYVVKKGEDLSFIPYNREDRRLETSRFDVGGVYTEGEGDRLNAFLFSDRGIYRPGDEFNIGMIVRSTDWKLGLEGVPLEAVVTDPRGLTVLIKKIQLGRIGFEELSYKTEETSPTGSYQVNLYIIKDGRRSSLLGSTTVQVEEFLPDRMKIATHFSTERTSGWVSPRGLKGLVSLQNLYGTPATDRRVAAVIRLNPAYPSFSKYRDFSFSDPLKGKNSFTDRLADARTDDKGEASFDLGLDRFEKATYRLVFEAEGFEADGGRSVSSQSSVLVSPLPYLVGYKPDGDLSYVKKSASRVVELIAVDPALTKVQVADLKARIVEQRYVSVLKKQSSGLYKYQSELKETTLEERPVAIPADGLKFTLPTEKPGDFVMVLVDKDGTELNKVPYSVVGEENLTRSLEKNSELQIKLNKSDYSPGEEIEVQIKAPYTGAGLITIERDRVYGYKWFRTTKTSSIQRITIPTGLEGNGYVNVSFVRAMDSEEVFMSPLSCGIQPFSVSLDERTVNIKLDAPALARPGEPFKIKYSSTRKGKAVIFAVDEGILQVAKYRTPNPVSYFFQKRALEVDTFQILDLILPEFSIVNELSAPGGGDYDEEALGKNLNPFKRKRDKPVAYWSGIVDIDGSERELVYDMPDYFNGTLRVMAVAVSDAAVGSADSKSTVKGYFVLSPNAPTFVAPGDEFSVSVNVANNVEGSGDNAEVKLSLNTPEQLDVLDGKERKLNIGEGREQSSSFRIRAKEKLGSAGLTFTTSSGGKRSTYTVHLSVRPPTPFMTTITGGYIKKGIVAGGTAEVQVARTMYPHFRTNEASGSPLPLGVANGLARFLGNYPYPCSEQLVSMTMPALVLRNRPEFGYTGGKAEEVLSRTMRILMARQNSEGGFGFWTANSHVSDFQCAYIMHFLTEARDSGYPVQRSMMDRGLLYMKTLAGNTGNTLSEARVSAYAVYILTRNGTVTSGYVSELEKYLEDNYPKQWKRDLAGIYLAATYKLLRVDRKAEDIIDGLKLGDAVEADYDNYYDSLVRDAQLLYILARHFPERIKSLDGDDILQVVDPVLKGYYSTISASYTIMALEAYADAAGDPKPSELVVTEFFKDNKSRPLVLTSGLFPKAEFSEEAVKLRFASDSDHTMFYQVTQAGFDRKPPTAEIKDKLEVQREYRNDRGDVVTSTKLGSELTVHLKVRAIERDGMKNIAVVDLLPGGFEVVLEPGARNNAAARTGAENSGLGVWRPEYADMREDRVLVFGTAGTTVKEFVYKIKATNRGTYSVPPAYGEAMYDPTVKARSLGGTMKVE